MTICDFCKKELQYEVSIVEVLTFPGETSDRFSPDVRVEVCSACARLFRVECGKAAVGLQKKGGRK